MGWKGRRIPIFVSVIYEAYVCQIGTLHLNSLSSNVLHRTVKFFYLLQLFNNTISMHPEMYHHSQYERWAPLDVIHIVPTFQGIKYLSPSPMNG